MWSRASLVEAWESEGLLLNLVQRHLWKQYIYQKGLYEFPRAAVTKYHKLEALNNSYCLMILEAGSLKSRCLQGLAPSEGSRKESFLASHLPAFEGNPWSSLAWNCMAPMSATTKWLSSPCRCVSKFFSSYRDTSHGGLGLTLTNSS